MSHTFFPNQGHIFEKDKWYQYITTIHESGTTVYHVGDTKYELDDDFLAFTSFPFIENKFTELFDNIQEIREEKINQILIN